MTSINNEECSSIVTPPDFVHNMLPSVLIIDPSVAEIENLAMYLATSKRCYNVYVYSMDLNDSQWLGKALSESSAVIVNTVDNASSLFKDTLAVQKTSYYYGHKNFLMNPNRLEQPVDYFVNNDSESNKL